MKSIFATSIFIAVLSMAASVGAVSAQETVSIGAGEGIVCAAVVPCDAQGDVLPGYDQGVCATQYKALCLQQQANDLSTQLAQCASGYKSVHSQLRAAKAQVVQLKKKLKKTARKH